MFTKTPVTLFIESKLTKNPTVSNKELLEATLAAGHVLNMKTVYNVRYNMKGLMKKALKKVKRQYTKRVVKHRRKYTRRITQVQLNPLNTCFLKIAANLGLIRSKQLINEFEKKVSV